MGVRGLGVWWLLVVADLAAWCEAERVRAERAVVTVLSSLVARASDMVMVEMKVVVMRVMRVLMKRRGDG